MSDLSFPDELAFTDAPAPTRKASLGAWLRDQSLASKLRLAISGSVVVPLLLIGGLLWCVLYLGQSGTQKARTATAQIHMAHAAMSLADVGRDAIALSDNADPLRRGHLQDDIREANRLLALSSGYTADEIPADIAAQIDLFEERAAGIQEVSQQLSSGASRASIEALASQSDALRQDIEAYSRELHKRTKAGGLQLIEEVDFAAKASIALTVIFGLLTVFFTRIIIRNMSHIIARLTGSMERLAKGETDVAIPGGERGDELGAMARALGVFRSSMLAVRDLTAERARHAEEELARQQALSDEADRIRDEKSRTLKSLADGFEASVGEVIASVSSASDQLRVTSKAMVSLAEGSITQSDQATAAMDEASTNVTAAAAATDEFALSISQISTRASASASLARDASDLVHSASARMDDLSVAAEEIGEIIELIQTIAQRTNLLALNASIEAARGGEAGVGFAVVAREVKDLANQTREAASNVTERVTAIQISTNSSAGDLDAIVSRIAELEEAAAAIATAVDQQSYTGEELARNIDTVAAGTSVVAQQLRDMNAASHKAGSAAKEVLDSAQVLGNLADNVRDNALVFLDKVRASSKSV